MTAITDKNLRDKLMKENALELKKTIELIKQNTFEKKNKKSTIPEALITTKGKQIIREEPLQRMENFGTRPKPKITETRPCKTLHRTGARYTSAPQCNTTATIAGRRDTMLGHVGREQTIIEP